MLSRLIGYNFLMMQHTTTAANTRKRSKAATIGIHTGSTRKETNRKSELQVNSAGSIKQLHSLSVEFLMDLHIRTMVRVSNNTYSYQDMSKKLGTCPRNQHAIPPVATGF